MERCDRSTRASYPQLAWDAVMRPTRVLIVGASPDHLNTNSGLRQFVRLGFEAAFPDAQVVGVGYEAAVSTAAGLSPDLTVVFGSVVIDSTDYYQLADVARRTGRLAFWLHDDPYEFDGNDRIFSIADIIFTNDAASIDFYPPNVNVHHLPLAACPAAHHRDHGRRVAPDLFFCGYLFANRKRFLTQLARSTSDFAKRTLLVGPCDGPREVPGWQIGTLPPSVLPDFYASAIAVLSIGRDLDLKNRRFGIRSSTPGPRTFEAALAGAAQIFVGDGLEVLDYFDAPSEILLAHSVEEFSEHWSRLRRDTALSLQIGARARSRAAAEHTYKHRVERLVSLISDS